MFERRRGIGLGAAAAAASLALAACETARYESKSVLPACEAGNPEHFAGVNCDPETPTLERGSVNMDEVNRRVEEMRREREGE